MKKIVIFFFIQTAAIQASIGSHYACDTEQLNIFNYETLMVPYFLTNSYSCNDGYFLPADSTECKPCPIGYVCNGGTFYFNKNISQGIILQQYIKHSTNNTCSTNFLHSTSNISNIVPIYHKNTYTCSVGFYLPAGNDWQNDTEGCRKCQENNYCPGGTYTFNETIAQGITICPENAPFAPIGIWDESQCGHKLHIGDDVLYVHKSPANPTTHRLYVRVNETVYSANTTPISESPDLKMSANAQRALHVKIDGIEYLVHDDSVR